MTTAQEVYKSLKKTGMMGDRKMSTSERRNVTPAMTEFIFEQGKRVARSNGAASDPIEITQKIADSLKPGSERHKGVEKVLKALREG